MASNRLLPRGGRSVLRSPILKCRPNLRVLPAGGVKGSASARARSREDSFGLFAVNAGQNGGGHVQEQSTGEGSEHGGKFGRSRGESRATATLSRSRAGADDEIGDKLLHRLGHVDCRQYRMQWSSA